MDAVPTDLFVNPPFAWLILAAMLAIVEVVTPSFWFILVAASAVVAAVAAWLGMPGTVQVSVFIVATVLSLWFVSPKLVGRL